MKEAPVDVSMEEWIVQLINELKETYLFENGLTGERDFKVKELPIAESGMLYLVMYKTKIAGTVLCFEESVVRTCYQDYTEMEAVN